MHVVCELFQPFSLSYDHPDNPWWGDYVQAYDNGQCDNNNCGEIWFIVKITQQQQNFKSSNPPSPREQHTDSPK